jgi:hypothetical protein
MTYLLVLKIDEHFKSTEITILEQEKKEILKKEYCDNVISVIVNESIKNSIHFQMLYAMISMAMTIED